MRDGAALADPGLRLVAGLGVAAHDRLAGDGVLSPHRVCCRLDLRRQRPRSGEAEDEVDAVGLAPFHRLGPGVVAVASEQEAGAGPAGADAPDEAPKVTAHLDARRRLARAQHHGYRTAPVGVPRVKPEDRL